MAQAKRDDNRVPTLLGVDSMLFETPTTAAVDPVTHEVLTKPSLPTGAATSANQTAPFTTYVSTTVTLTTANTAYKLPSSEQSGRKSLVVYNKSDTDVYWGDSSVTTSTGVLLEAGEKVAINSESGVYCVCGSDGKTVNVLELK